MKHYYYDVGVGEWAMRRTNLARIFMGERKIKPMVLNPILTKTNKYINKLTIKLN